MLADILQEPTVGTGQQMYVQETEQPSMQPMYAQKQEQSSKQPTCGQPSVQQPRRQSPAQQPTDLVNHRRNVQQADAYNTQEEMHLQPKKEKVTKETQKASLMLRFLLPILIVLIIGAAVAIYVVLIHPVNQEEETTTAAPTTTEVTTEATTTEETTEATTEEAECPYEYSQKITVTAHAGSTSGTLTVYNWEHGDWVNKYSVACVLGRNGIGSDYGEGKGVTPMGTFKLGFVMANVDPKNNMNFKLASDSTAIVDDAESELYNTLVDTNTVGDVSVDYVGSNIVNGKLNAIIFIEHNGDGLSSDGVTPGKGSVITICGNYSNVSETAGCIDISAQNMTELLKLLDGNMNPHIEITLN